MRPLPSLSSGSQLSPELAPEGHSGFLLALYFPASSENAFGVRAQMWPMNPQEDS